MARNKPRPAPKRPKSAPTKTHQDHQRVGALILPKKPVAKSMLDSLKEGREFESLISYEFHDAEIVEDLKRCIDIISKIRKRPVVCYAGNVVKPTTLVPTSVHSTDDLPFYEMIHSIPASEKKIDIIVVTPGGSGEQISKFVNILRPRFDEVGFIILNQAMSAGTIWVMSGDEIIMSDQSYIGPIDPQFLSREGRYLPAQALLTLIEHINEEGKKAISKGMQPSWAHLQILNKLDHKEVGAALSASNFSIELVKEYLYKYKFKTWTNHSKTGMPVTDQKKKERSLAIATLLCDHSVWKSHSFGISRDAAWDICQLRITHAETHPGLNEIMRKMWAILYFFFENARVGKLFLSENYCIIRFEKEPQINQ